MRCTNFMPGMFKQCMYQFQLAGKTQKRLMIPTNAINDKLWLEDRQQIPIPKTNVSNCIKRALSGTVDHTQGYAERWHAYRIAHSAHRTPNVFQIVLVQHFLFKSYSIRAISYSNNGIWSETKQNETKATTAQRRMLDVNIELSYIERIPLLKNQNGNMRLVFD